MAYVPEYSFMIGVYSSGSAAMSNVEVDGSGNYSAPNWEYKPYSKEIQLGDGTVRGAGWATAIWRWDVMTDTQRDWLRQYIPNESAELWIQTHTQDLNEPGEYAVFHAVGVWPTQTEEHSARRRIKFEIKFQRLLTT